MWQFQIRHQLYVTRDKRDISSVWKGSVTRDWRIEWNCTVPHDQLKFLKEDVVSSDKSKLTAEPTQRIEVIFIWENNANTESQGS